MPKMRPDRHVSQAVENASIYMQLRPPHSPDGRNAVPVNAHPAYHLVPCHVSVHLIAEWRERKGSPEAYGRDLQDRMAHVQRNPQVHGLG